MTTTQSTPANSADNTNNAPCTFCNPWLVPEGEWVMCPACDAADADAWEADCAADLAAQRAIEDRNHEWASIQTEIDARAGF